MAEKEMWIELVEMHTENRMRTPIAARKRIKYFTVSDCALLLCVNCRYYV